MMQGAPSVLAMARWRKPSRPVDRLVRKLKGSMSCGEGVRSAECNI